MKKVKHSNVMTIANKLVKQGYNRANAMVKAWALIKMPQLLTSVAGVTYGKRQTAIEHLTRYNPQDIGFSLVRDHNNSFDSNAIGVIATVRNKGSYCMGYLPKALATFLAPLMDKGRTVKCLLREIKGLYQPYMNYGLGIEVII